MRYVDYFTKHDDFVVYKAGETIFNEGDEANKKMYAVRAGEVEIVHNDVLLETVRPGYFFGEMSLVDAAPRAANAIAKTDCEIVEVDKYHFLYLIGEAPMFALQVMHIMAERIRKLHERVK
ncbi:MAG: Crp/Fnr family transcriptional regulator [Chloroflexota bacterium]